MAAEGKDFSEYKTCLKYLKNPPYVVKNLSLGLKGKSSEKTRENLKVGKNPQFNYSVIRTSSFEESTSRQKLLYKMEFPGDWTVLGEADFEIAAARDPGALGMDVMAQVRDNGRVVKLIHNS